MGLRYFVSTATQQVDSNRRTETCIFWIFFHVIIFFRREKFNMKDSKLLLSITEDNKNAENCKFEVKS